MFRELRTGQGLQVAAEAFGMVAVLLAAGAAATPPSTHRTKEGARSQGRLPPRLCAGELQRGPRLRKRRLSQTPRPRGETADGAGGDRCGPVALARSRRRRRADGVWNHPAARRRCRRWSVSRRKSLFWTRCAAAWLMRSLAAYSAMLTLTRSLPASSQSVRATLTGRSALRAGGFGSCPRCVPRQERRTSDEFRPHRLRARWREYRPAVRTMARLGHSRLRRGMCATLRTRGASPLLGNHIVSVMYDQERNVSEAPINYGKNRRFCRRRNI